jgi:hypothetical protein
MNPSILLRNHVAAFAAAVLTGCAMNAGASTAPPARGAIANSVLHYPVAGITKRGMSDISRTGHTKSDAYVYISDYGSNDIYVYGLDTKTGTFGSEVGSTNSGISGPQGLCASAKGEAYVANTDDSSLVGYKAPSTTSNVMLNDAGEFPAGCAVDSQGDVAVSNICSAPYCEGGDVAIFKGGGGSPTAATCPNLQRYYFIAYDAKGNIWIDGEDSSYAFAACEIRAGTTIGRAVTFNSAPQFPGAVQWWRKYLLVADQDTSAIDLFRAKHFSAKLVKSLSPAPSLGEIFGKYLLSVNSGGGSVATYTFPALQLVDTLQCCSEPIGIVVAK